MPLHDITCMVEWDKYKLQLHFVCVLISKSTINTYVKLISFIKGIWKQLNSSIFTLFLNPYSILDNSLNICLCLTMTIPLKNNIKTKCMQIMFKDCIFIRVIHEKCTPWLLDHIVLKLMCCLVVLLHVPTFKIVSFSLQFCQLVKEKEYLFI